MISGSLGDATNSSLTPIKVASASNLFLIPYAADGRAAKNPLICTLHGKVCARGVCKVHAEMVREQRRIGRGIEIKQQREAAEKRRAEREKKAKKSFKDESDSSSPTSSSPPARAPPSHLRSGAAAPSPGSARSLPPHLKAGAPPLASPPSSGPPALAARSVPDRDDDDDADAVHPSRTARRASAASARAWSKSCARSAH